MREFSDKLSKALKHEAVEQGLPVKQMLEKVLEERYGDVSRLRERTDAGDGERGLPKDDVVAREAPGGSDAPSDIPCVSSVRGSSRDSGGRGEVLVQEVAVGTPGFGKSAEDFVARFGIGKEVEAPSEEKEESSPMCPECGGSLVRNRIMRYMECGECGWHGKRER